MSLNLLITVYGNNYRIVPSVTSFICTVYRHKNVRESSTDNSWKSAGNTTPKFGLKFCHHPLSLL